MNSSRKLSAASASAAIEKADPPECKEHNNKLAFGCDACRARVYGYWKCGCGDWRFTWRSWCPVCKHKKPRNVTIDVMRAVDVRQRELLNE